MKLGTQKRGAALPQDAVEVLHTWGSKKACDTPYWPLLVLIADVMDNIAKGEDAYMIIGATRNRDACSLTVKCGSDFSSIYGDTFKDLAEKGQELV